MTPESQRIAIAEACGYTRVYKGRSNVYGQKPGNHRIFATPDYLNDLNAMHEAEKTLAGGDHALCAFWLSRVINGEADIFSADDCAQYYEVPYSRAFELAHATAAQRAEAFLRAKGLWREESQAVESTGR